MPNNPEREARGGDVSGTTPADVTHGEAIRVAKASFDPGYSLETTLNSGHVQKADLAQGYCAYGKSTGETGAY